MNAGASHLTGFSTNALTFILRRDLTSFIEKSFYELNPGKALTVAPYVELLAAKLEAVRAGRVKRLIINLPPRYLKSHSASVVFPAWLLGHHPNKTILCVSYGQDLVDELGEASLRLMSSAFYQKVFGRLLSGRQSASDIRTVRRGRRIAVSVGGALTGAVPISLSLTILKKLRKLW